MKMIMLAKKTTFLDPAGKSLVGIKIGILFKSGPVSTTSLG
jgi:hypothetical protein